MEIRTGQKAQTNNPGTFVDFKTALQATNGYNGLGFLISDGVFVIDCDHCRGENDQLAQPAVDIVSMFAGCYMEWSPSGSGLHILGRAAGFRFVKEKYWMNNRRIGVEVYISGCTNRFMTITGNAFREGDIPDKTKELQTFLDKYMDRKKTAPAPPVATESTLSDDEIITKALNARNGTAFRRLWSGDPGGYA